MTLLVTGGTYLEENYIGTNFANYGSFSVLSHFMLWRASVEQSKTPSLESSRPKRKPSEPNIYDIDILTFTDPVVLNQAYFDLTYVIGGGNSLIQGTIPGTVSMHLAQLGICTQSSMP